MGSSAKTGERPVWRIPPCIAGLFFFCVAFPVAAFYGAASLHNAALVLGKGPAA